MFSEENFFATPLVGGRQNTSTTDILELQGFWDGNMAPSSLVDVFQH
jgi:hypothetical protein